MQGLLGLAAVVALVACKPAAEPQTRGANDGSTLCEAFGGGHWTVDATVSPGSTFESPDLAFDGDLSSFADYRVTDDAGTLVVRGIAKTGAVRRDGSAGVLVSRPVAGQTLRVTISTYLDGKLQSVGDTGAQTSAGQVCRDCSARGDAAYFGIGTTTSFDAIEARIQLEGRPGQLAVKELCSR